MEFEIFKKAIEQLGKPCSASNKDLYEDFLKHGKVYFADTGNSGADDLLCVADEYEARAIITDYFMEDIAAPDHFRTEENCCTIIDMTEVFGQIAADIEIE